MTFLSVIYTLIISPLELLFEVVFSIADRITGNEGLSIIFLSLAINFLVLPLYKRADELQAEEREIQAKMAYRIKRTKQTFKGDERFLMLQEYYRINHYKPVYALKSSVSLLLQIPFFIAAYRLLSGMQSLQGMRFGFITDLGKEDAMFMIGSFPVNVLPILMTLINVVSGIIYTKGHPLKSKIQVYGLAAVFLVLLYHSPSGLVFYWLLNNVFSLAKNIVCKLKDPKMARNIILSFIGVVILGTTVVRTDLDIRQKLLLTAGCVLLCSPLISGFFKNNPKGRIKADSKNSPAFVLGTVLMGLITGLLIPANVISDSPIEFFDAVLPQNPVIYIVNSLLLSFGSWVLWGGVFYFFMSDRNKVLFSKMVWIISGVSIADYMLFGTKMGNISSTLKYDLAPSFSVKEYVLNALAVIGIAVVFIVLYRLIPQFIKPILIIAVISVLAVGALNLAGIWGTYDGYQYHFAESEDIPELHLSKNGKNVVVLMIDRAAGTQVPYIFNEKPELVEKFDGFTYYPNTLSYGAYTQFGAPALYGGYDYTPERINERSDETLKDKHNESLKVMPVIFGEHGYEVTVCDPSFANYEWIPDLSIFDDYPDFRCYNTNGQFSIFDEDDEGRAITAMSERLHSIRNRNFFFFSLMKISPLIVQETIYDGGMYNESYSNGNSDELSAFAVVQNLKGTSISSGYNMEFIKAYSVLRKLPDITFIDDSSENTFLMFANETAHSPSLLQEPDYTPANFVDNTGYDADMISRYTIDGITMDMSTETQVTHYHANMAAYIQLGEWFDYLRENGVYDNTRIIVVSDHSFALDQFDIKCDSVDMECFMPVLMVKDFNSTGFNVCEDFMTNGDTPAIATYGLIDDPVNPFTGNPIYSTVKNGPQTVFLSDDWDVEYNNDNKYIFVMGSFYTFTGGDIHDPDNWVYSG